MLTAGFLAVRLQAVTGVEVVDTGINSITGTEESGITLLATTSPLSSQHITVSGTDGNAWTLTTSTIDLFQSSYQNENKQVTVQSSDGKKVIAPGASGSYTFYVKNTGRTQLSYRLWLEKAFQVTTDSGEPAALPVQVRMSSGTSQSRTWLLGSSDTVWVAADTLKNIETAEAGGENIPQDSIAGALDASESISYTLEWQWPYETGADANDILLGNSENAELTLQVSLIAEAEEEPETEETETIVRRDPNTTGDGSRETGTTPDENTMPDEENIDEGTMPGDGSADGNTTPDDGSADENTAPDDGNTDENTTPDDGETIVRKDPNITDDDSRETGNTPNEGGSADDVPVMTTKRTHGIGGRLLLGGIMGGIAGSGSFFIILFRRITLTGFMQDENGAYMEGCTLRLEQSRHHKTKESEVDEDGRFKIRWIPLGKKTLILLDKNGNEIARNELRLKRYGKRRIDDSLEIGEKKEENVYTEIDMRYHIASIEIYLHQRSTSSKMAIETDRWSARSWLEKKYESGLDKSGK
jgi:hypothetical protein